MNNNIENKQRKTCVNLTAYVHHSLHLCCIRPCSFCQSRKRKYNKYTVYLRLSKIIREKQHREHQNNNVMLQFLFQCNNDGLIMWCLFWNKIPQLSKWSIRKRKTHLWKIILCRIAYISGARKSCQSETSFASLGVRDKRQHMRSRKIAPDWWSSDV